MASPLVRFEDWEIRLDKYLSDVRFKPFQYGVFDCATFTCGAVEAITGENLMGALPSYRSYKQGRLLMAKLSGGNNMQQFADYAFSGLMPVAKGFQQRGDIVLLSRKAKDKWDASFALGIIALDGKPKSVDVCGYQMVPPERIVKGWRV